MYYHVSCGVINLILIYSKSDIMKKNVGTIDRVFRLVVGIALITYGIVNQSWLMGLIGIVPILTAFIRFCPLYTIIGVSTCKVEPKS